MGQQIEQLLATPATITSLERTKDGFQRITSLYQPVNFQDEHGTVVAQIVEINEAENTVYTSRYYSRGWAYWNFQDISGDDFEAANFAMALEGDYIDHTINMAEDALNVIESDNIPHANPYWQALVVRTAYNAIANADEFANMVKGGNFTQAQVQRMIDLAVGAVLSSNQFTLTGFNTIAA